MLKRKELNFYDKYKELIWFCILTFIILFIGLIKHTTDLWSFLESIDTATAIALAVLAFMAYKEYGKNEDEIELKMAIYEKNNYSTPIKIVDFEEISGDKIKILRKEVSRGEILGLLGMLQKDTPRRYSMSDNRLIVKFLNNLKEVQKAKSNVLLIPMLKEDFEKYFAN